MRGYILDHWRGQHAAYSPIEIATELAEALEVSLDYLVGSTDVLLEKTIVNRVFDIQKKESEKQHVFALLDAFIKQA